VDGKGACDGARDEAGPDVALWRAAGRPFLVDDPTPAGVTDPGQGARVRRPARFPLPCLRGGTPLIYAHRSAK